MADLFGPRSGNLAPALLLKKLVRECILHNCGIAPDAPY